MESEGLAVERFDVLRVQLERCVTVFESFIKLFKLDKGLRSYNAVLILVGALTV